MATLTVEFTGILDEVLTALVKQGFAKTKAEAVRMTLMHYGQEFGLVKPPSIHAKAEEYTYQETKRRFRN